MMATSTSGSAIGSGFTWSLREIACPLCGHHDARRLGVRGNREHHGADPNAEPHVWTYVVRCGHCDLIYANPHIDGAELLEQAHYADPVAYAAAAEGHVTQMFRQRLQLIEALRRPASLLDVGAGKGEFLAEAQRRGWRVDGIEPSAPFCRYALETFGLRIRHGFLAETSGLPEHAFDIVTLNHVLEHVDQPIPLLALCLRYVKPGGMLFVEVPNADSYLLRLADRYFRVKGLRWSSRLSPTHPPFHHIGYTARSLRYALEHAGWRVDVVKTFSGRDRGTSGKGDGRPAARLRDLASAALEQLGNRELLAIVAHAPS